MKIYTSLRKTWPALFAVVLIKPANRSVRVYKKLLEKARERKINQSISRELYRSTIKFLEVTCLLSFNYYRMD